jgi:hypothetical protein
MNFISPEKSTLFYISQISLIQKPEMLPNAKTFEH